MVKFENKITTKVIWLTNENMITDGELQTTGSLGSSMIKNSDFKKIKNNRETYPNIKFDIFIRYSFYIESYSGYCCNRLTKFQLV